MIAVAGTRRAVADNVAGADARGVARGAQVQHLRNNAKLMARCTGLHVQNDNGWRALGNGDFQHGDFEFFLRRMAAI